MMLSLKPFVALLGIVLIQYTIADGSSLLNRKTRSSEKYVCTDRRSINEDSVEERSAIAVGAVISIVQLTTDLLKTLLDTLGSIERKIAIGIGNDTPYAWQADGVYFRSGTSDAIFPYCLSSQEATTYLARKTDGPVATGTVGVFCYYIPDRKVSLCAMFSVPFDYNLYSNWWDVQAFSGAKTPNQQLYEHMYYGNPYKGDNRYHQKNLGYGFKLSQGFMTSNGSARLIIKIKAD